jgi:diguanylate cyclase (GGDEF)-like protein
MGVFAKNYARFMVLFRWLAFIAIFLDFSGRHATDHIAIRGTFAPDTTVLLVTVLIYFLLASFVEIYLTSPVVTYSLAALDIILGILLLLAMPRPELVLVFALPVLGAFRLGNYAGSGIAVFSTALFAMVMEILSMNTKGAGSFFLSNKMFFSACAMVLAGYVGYCFQCIMRQEDQIRALITVIRASQELGSTATLENVLKTVANVVMTLFKSHTVAIYLKDDSAGGISNVLKVREVVSATPSAFTDFDPEISQSVVGKVYKSKEAMLVLDFQEEASETVIQKAKGFKTAMVTPLIFEDKPLGCIFLAHSSAGVYDEGHLRLFAMLSNQVALAIRNIQLHKGMEVLAITDSLSGLFTHGYFQDRLNKELIKAKYENQPLGLMILDVDFFKKVNDTYGHPQGDALLRQLGGVIKSVTRPADIICRYGGDEFTIIMPGTNRIGTVVVAERIRKEVEEYEFVLGSNIVHVTVSGGVAAFPDDAETKKEIIEITDHNMYEAKHKGRNKVCFSG